MVLSLIFLCGSIIHILVKKFRKLGLFTAPCAAVSISAINMEEWEERWRPLLMCHKAHYIFQERKKGEGRRAGLALLLHTGSAFCGSRGPLTSNKLQISCWSLDKRWSPPRLALPPLVQMLFDSNAFVLGKMAPHAFIKHRFYLFFRLVSSWLLHQDEAVICFFLLCEGGMCHFSEANFSSCSIEIVCQIETSCFSTRTSCFLFVVVWMSWAGKGWKKSQLACYSD